MHIKQKLLFLLFFLQALPVLYPHPVLAEKQEDENRIDLFSSAKMDVRVRKIGGDTTRQILVDIERGFPEGFSPEQAGTIAKAMAEHEVFSLLMVFMEKPVLERFQLLAITPNAAGEALLNPETTILSSEARKKQKITVSSIAEMQTSRMQNKISNILHDQETLRYHHEIHEYRAGIFFDILDMENQVEKNSAVFPSGKYSLQTNRLQAVELCSAVLGENKAYETLQYKEKMDLLNQSIALDPRFPLPLVLKGNLLQDRGDYQRALAAYQKALDIFPAHAGAYIGLAGIYRKTGNDKKALLRVSSALSCDPVSAAAFNLRGAIYYRMKQKEQALYDFNQALEYNPGFARAYVNRGILWYNENSTVKALSDFTRALEIQPGYALAYFSRGLVWRRNGKIDQAEKDFSHTLKHDPDFFKAYTNRGIVRAKQGNYEEAIADFTMALNLSPASKEAAINRAICYQKTGKPKQAIKDYTLYLEIAGNQDGLESQVKKIIRAIQREST